MVTELSLDATWNLWVPFIVKVEWSVSYRLIESVVDGEFTLWQMHIP